MPATVRADFFRQPLSVSELHACMFGRLSVMSMVMSVRVDNATGHGHAAWRRYRISTVVSTCTGEGLLNYCICNYWVLATGNVGRHRY